MTEREIPQPEEEDNTIPDSYGSNMWRGIVDAVGKIVPTNPCNPKAISPENGHPSLPLNDEHDPKTIEAAEKIVGGIINAQRNGLDETSRPYANTQLHPEGENETTPS